MNQIQILISIRSSSLLAGESGLIDHLLEQLRAVSLIDLVDQPEKAKIYYSMTAYVEDNTREFIKLKLNYFWYLFNFTTCFPLVLLFINLLEKTHLFRRRARHRLYRPK